MKIAIRILIILLAAALIAGITYGITQLSSGSGSTAAEGFQHSGEGGRERAEGGNRGAGEGFNPGAFEGEHSHSTGANFSTTLENLGKIGIITAIVIAISLGLDQVKRARHRRKSQPA
ncbi:MAG: hypothetical protein JXJ17_06890 [Anaerolineae bacterium]|nr:hypothetical protein [Anaerolineae bacterium]